MKKRTLKPWIVPIPGTRTPDRLEDNLGAAEIALTAKELATLDETLSAIHVSGDRYPPELAKRVGK